MTNRDDPLHLAPLIERLAQEAWERANRARGLRSVDGTTQQSSVLCQFTRELVAVVAEECAKVCDEEAKEWTDWAKQCAAGPHDADAAAYGARDCAAEIRYLFAPDVKKPPEGGR
jgi:hypothetical protein